MAFIKKEWKNRLVEFAGRRKLTRVAGSIDNQIIVDVTREEGAVSQQGDAFSEENMNDLENRIEEGFNDTIDKDSILDEEATEANTAPNKYVSDATVTRELLLRQNGVQWLLDENTGAIKGYKTKAGADTEFPFNLGKLSYVSSLNGYPDVNIENAIVGKKYLISGYMSNVSGSVSINKITGAEIIIENNLVSTKYRYGDYYQFATLAVVKATDTTVNLSYNANGYACFLIYQID